MPEAHHLPGALLHMRDRPAAAAVSNLQRSMVGGDIEATAKRRGRPLAVPRSYIDEEWDRDAIFTCRNLVTVEFAAQQLKVTTHSIDKAANRIHGALLMWVFGGRGQLMRKYREMYVDMGPRPGPDLPHAWQGHSSEELLGEVRQRYADLPLIDAHRSAAT